MTHVTCRLTAENRDRLRKPTLGNRVWATRSVGKLWGYLYFFLEIFNPAAGYANRFLGISESGYGSSATPRPSGGPANSLMTVAPVHQTCTRRRQLEGIADRRTRLPDDDAATSAATPQQMAVTQLSLARAEGNSLRGKKMKPALPALVSLFEYV